MKISVLFRINPPFVFGLPDGDKIVVPGGTVAEFNIHRGGGGRLRPVTVSQYRLPSERLNESHTCLVAEIVVEDNYCTLKINADTQEQGFKRCEHLMRQFVRKLMIYNSCYLEAQLIHFELEDGRIAKYPDAQEQGTVAGYSLPELRGTFVSAVPKLDLDEDEPLNAALIYFEHARYLMDVARNFNSSHSDFIQASAFLYFWKVITAILGDPSIDKDHQKRFRIYGFEKDFWRKSIDPFKRLRDSADVAHHSLDRGLAKEVVKTISAIDKVCRDVMSQYSDWLFKNRRGLDKSDATAVAKT